MTTHKIPRFNINKNLSSIDLLNSLRNFLEKESISFIQVGVNDGKKHDVANHVLKENDFGYFIEPIESSFEKMKHNKNNFKNAKFVKKAMLPEVLKGNNTMNLLTEDSNNEGTSFSKINSHRIFSQIVVDTTTVSDFLIEEKINELDFFFCDAESIDHLIIQDLVTRITPNVLFFETCWWCTEDYDLEMSDGNHVTVPSRKNIKTILNNKGYDVVDYWEHELYKREDMLAFRRDVFTDVL